MRADERARSRSLSENLRGESAPFGQMEVHPLRTHEPQGSFLSHLSFSLRSEMRQRRPSGSAKKTHRRHSAHEISPLARLSSISSSVLILRELRLGSAGIATIQ